MSGTFEAHRRELRRKLWVGIAVMLVGVPAGLILLGEALHRLAVLLGAAP
jgi:hypothetical protein